jgi:mannosyltransferase
MATVASTSRPTRLPSVREIPSAAIWTGVIVAALTVLSLFLRTRALGASLWMDEGLSIGIAGQPLFDIPSVLKQDGSPPLYYMLLHGWMDAFGDGPAQTQGLSVLISLVAVPGGFWAGWSLFGRRAGLILAALAAVNPFLTNYAQETRMYSLMVVLSLLSTAAFVNVFIYRRRGYIPLFGLLLAAMIYTHNWGLFVGVGLFAGLVPVLASSEDRRPLVKDALIGFGIAALLYLPWLPTLLYQVSHTGAPWLNSPRLGAPVQISKSLLGGGTATVALVLAAGSGLAAVLAKSTDERQRRAIYVTFTIGVATLVFAWLVSQVSPAWTTRYLGVALGPLLILSAAGLARAGKLGIVGLIIVAGIWIIPHTSNLENKSNAADLGGAVGTKLHPGDVVVTLQPEQHPLIHYNIPPGMREATEIGPVKTKGVMDWRDAEDKLKAATPEKNLKPLVDTLRPSQQVLLVYPVTTNIDDWDAPWTQLVRRRASQWGSYMSASKCFTREEAVPPFYRRARRIGVRGVIYTKNAGC